MTDVHERLRRYWDRDASVYDRSPTHAGTDRVEAAAWRAALIRHLPPPPASILDVGAGTGALALILAELGHRVTALDLSDRMLARAREKARAADLHLQIVVGRATQPPPGPFDVVVERHLLWTLPDPVAALRSWRESAPLGRLVCYEAIVDRRRPAARARRAVASLARAALAVPREHHAEYDRQLAAALPLAGRVAPAAMVSAAAAAGWRRPRIERLRDVEWSRRLMARPPLGWLEGVPHVALLAEA